MELFYFVFVFTISVLSVSCSLVVTCWERAEFLARLCICHFPIRYFGSGIVLPDILPHFERHQSSESHNHITSDKYDTCTHFLVSDIIEPRHELFNNVECATSKCSDQPAHMRSLVRAFASRLNIL